MPSMSGGVLRRDMSGKPGQCTCTGFYALDVGRGFATSNAARLTPEAPPRFYALDVGRGFATSGTPWVKPRSRVFLCPRCRAGFCDLAYKTLDYIREHPFLCPRCRAGFRDRFSMVTPKRASNPVSMPSMSGGVLRRDGDNCMYTRTHAFLCPRCRAGFCDGCRLR